MYINIKEMFYLKNVYSYHDDVKFLLIRLLKLNK